MGKTASVIGLALTESASDAIGPNLIITPSHLFGQWKDEIIKFAGGVVRVIEGMPAYEAAVAEAGPLNNHVFVIVDVQDVIKKSSRKW